MHSLSRLLAGGSLAIGLVLLTLGSDGLSVETIRGPMTPEWGRQRASIRADNPSARSVGANAAAKQRISGLYGRLPLSFEKNEGQTDPRVEFLSRGPGRTLFLSASGEATLALSGTAGAVGGAPDTGDPVSGARRGPTLPNTMAKGETARGTGAVLRLKLVGASRNAHAEGREKLPGKVNYLRGDDPSVWRAGISTYARVAYENIYPGIDLVYYGNQRQLEYDFIVRPGVDPRVIALEAEGADRIEVDERGDLVLHVGNRQVRQQKPVVYQEVQGVRRELDGRYALRGSDRVTFRLGAYNPALPLIIDPVLEYSTYLGGDDADGARAVAVDAHGQAYVTGSTSSSNFPTTVGAQDTSTNGDTDVFVTKLNATGTSLMYSTYLGGSGTDGALGIAVDAGEHAYVTGSTSSTISSPNSDPPIVAFPTTDSTYDENGSGGVDAFVTKLDAAGAALYSIVLRGANEDTGTGIAVDAAGVAYVTGYTYSSSAFPPSSSDFPTTIGADHGNFVQGFADAFVTKLSTTGAIVYSTVLGGARDDLGQAVAVDATGYAYVTGYTSSSDFPPRPLDPLSDGDFDVFVTKLDPGGATSAYTTFLAGADNDLGKGIAVDAEGAAYVTGYTYSSSSSDFPPSSGDFPTTAGGNHGHYVAGFADAFVTKLGVTGATLDYSIVLGGTADDMGRAIAVDAEGEAYVTGNSYSTDFPSAGGPDSFGGSSDAFVTKLDATGATLVYSIYLGGTSDDTGHGIAVDATGNAYVAGITSSSDSPGLFPTTPGAYDTIFNGPTEAFVTKVSEAAPPPPPPLTVDITPSAATNTVGKEHCVIATVRDASGNPVPGVTVRFSVTGLNADIDSGSPVTNGNGEASFCYTGTHAGVDTIWAFADTDRDRIQDDNERGDTAEKTYLPGAPAALILTPASGSNPVDAQHCVTAAVRDSFGNPTPNVTVRFTVTGAVNTSGTALTSDSGQGTFCYTGPPLPGADAIRAYADIDNDNIQDANEPGGAATKTWVLPAPVPGCGSVFGIGYITVANRLAGFAFDVDQDSSGKIDGDLGYLAWGRKPFRSTKILQLIITGNTATIHGLGYEYGGPGAAVVTVPFRVDVTVGDRDTFRITWPGYTAGGSVTGEIIISARCGHDVHTCNGDFHHRDGGTR